MIRTVISVSAFFMSNNMKTLKSVQPSITLFLRLTIKEKQKNIQSTEEQKIKSVAIFCVVRIRGVVQNRDFRGNKIMEGRLVKPSIFRKTVSGG